MCRGFVGSYVAQIISIPHEIPQLRPEHAHERKETVVGLVRPLSACRRSRCVSRRKMSTLPSSPAVTFPLLGSGAAVSSDQRKCRSTAAVSPEQSPNRYIHTYIHTYIPSDYCGDHLPHLLSLGYEPIGLKGMHAYIHTCIHTYQESKHSLLLTAYWTTYYLLLTTY